MTHELFSYQTINSECIGKYTEKGSKFYAYVIPMQTLAQLEFRLSQLKSEYSKARHFCYAYRIVVNGVAAEFSSDAGEPSGSAGQPILNALKSAGVYDAGVIVVRIYGGSKLGIPGLIHAYRTSTEDALKSASIVGFERTLDYTLSLPMSLQPHMLEACKKLQITTSDLTYDQKFGLTLRLPLQTHQDLLLDLFRLISKRELSGLADYLEYLEVEITELQDPGDQNYGTGLTHQGDVT